MHNNTLIKLNLLCLMQTLDPPLGSHPQSFNLLPWRMHYVNYRWRKLRRWLLGLTLVFSLWIVGLFTLSYLQDQQLSMQQQWLQNVEQQILTHAQQRQQLNERTGQRFLHQQVGIHSWQQQKEQQSWLIDALQTIQHIVAPVNGVVQQFILHPNTGNFTFATMLSWHQIEQTLPLHASLRIKNVAAASHEDTRVQLSIHTMTSSQPLNH